MDVNKDIELIRKAILDCGFERPGVEAAFIRVSINVDGAVDMGDIAARNALHEAELDLHDALRDLPLSVPVQHQTMDVSDIEDEIARGSICVFGGGQG